MSPSSRWGQSGSFEFDDALVGQADALYVPGQGLPLDVPFDTNQPEASTQVNGLRARRRGTDTPHSSSSPRVPRVTSRRLEQLAAYMPERDHEVLRLIAEHRYLTTNQIRRFVCINHASKDSAARIARRLTRRLSKTGLIRALGRRIGGSQLGSTATIWQLSPAGARLIREGEANWRTSDPSPRFLRHCLAVADVHVALRDLAHPAPRTDVTVIGRKVHVENEPDCWRRYTGPGGEPRWLQPDLFARVTSPEFVDRWFIEVDLGTESLPSLVRKCAAYQDYYASGTEQAAHGSFPLVLWVFTDPERAARLERSVLRHRSLTRQMFRFATVGETTQVLETGG